MKRLLPLGLLALLLVQPAGHFILFECLRYQIRRDVARRILSGLDSSRLAVVPVPVKLEKNGGNRFRWVDEGEFRFDGRMYDVVRSHRRGDTTWYFCIEDEKESDLLAGLDDVIRREMSGEGGRRRETASLLRLCSSVFLPPPPCDLAVSLPRSSIGVERDVLLMHFRPEPPSPPPKITIAKRRV